MGTCIHTIPFKSLSFTDTFSAFRLTLIVVPFSDLMSTGFLLSGGGFFHNQHPFSGYISPKVLSETHQSIDYRPSIVEHVPRKGFPKLFSTIIMIVSLFNPTRHKLTYQQQKN